MIFYVCPYFNPKEQQTLEVFFEETFLGEIQFEKDCKDWQAYNMLLPAKLITKTSHIMKFKSAYIISPYEVSNGEIQDHRKLGIGFKLIKFSM